MTIHSVINSIGISIAVVIGIYSLVKTIENSYPWIDIRVKSLEEVGFFEFKIKNTGKTTAFDLYTHIILDWGSSSPDRIHIEKLLPQQTESRRVGFPPNKKGAVYTLNTITRCKRRNLIGKKKDVPEQKESSLFDVSNISGSFSEVLELIDEKIKSNGKKD